MRYILILLSLSLATCATAKIPADFLYVADLVNGVCAEYKIIDQTTFKVALNRELKLTKSGPCDRMVGFSRHDFKAVQNFIRDQVRACK